MIQLVKHHNDKSEGRFSTFTSEISLVKEQLTRDHVDVLQKNLQRNEVREELESIIQTLVIQHFHAHRLTHLEQQDVVQHILQQMCEFGQITDLYYTEGVTDIHINDAGHVSYRKDGMLYASAIQFASKDEVAELAKKMLRKMSETHSGQERSVNYVKPIENGYLADGTRFNVMIDPIATKGTTISIRKHREGFLTLAQHIEKGTFSKAMASYLEKSVQSRVNTLIVGGGGTGKTEIVRLLGTFIPDGLRIDTIEDTLELKLEKVKRHVRAFQYRTVLKENMKGSAYDILRTGSLRSDVDIVIIGEILENNTFDITLDAMAIGQPGTMATLHSNNAKAGLYRGVNMIAAEYPNLSEHFIMRRIAESVEQVITVKRDRRDGRRRVAAITQVCGVENGDFVLQDVFRYTPSNGHIRTEHGLHERIQEKMEENGVVYE
ncbi:ATPase, T2SS/T4P/T4SS family [Longirhabdus pacifica]|uniref:ATPase, T2SS/T4P/T4SS family n=1 Tax=Longirhabdus pacifica TaxID=2305227 RepID=UPI001008728E|nr:ATPase, T2SS/T4P/T4SS family [Longirhabdus pacifica]